MSAMRITGNVGDRFIQAAVLLHMLDPVRGEPTTHGLDQDPHEIETPRERMLKRKFLDSFALLCATKKDGDSVSAACMEEGLPQGPIIRIASNAGVRESTIYQLQQILDFLNGVRDAGIEASAVEKDILRRIIALDIAKIRFYLKEIRASKDFLEPPISGLENRIRESLQSIPYFDSFAIHRFLEWLRQVFSIRDLPSELEPKDLLPCIRCAQEAKKHYLEFLKAAFSAQAKQLPRWVCTVFKLGRYGIACRALIQLASEFPALFNPMTVQSVAAPASTTSTLHRPELPLTCVLRRVAGSSAEAHHSRLARIWNTADPEAHFRRACSLNLRVHAEMQLLSFYNHNYQSRPSFRFIGALTIELSKIMEGSAKQDLETRLGGLKRPVPADSTAGVSLSGLSNSNLARKTGQDHSVETSKDTPRAIVPTEESVDSKQVFSPIEVISLSSIEESCFDRGEAPPITAIVFHFTRADSTTRQDIVSMGDILDPHTNYPSWKKLVRILEANDGASLGFKEDLVINVKWQS
ncbi:hypothetical protein BU23DRAFT_579833 [Bimuria novae-zelandiae CBS 107.79]|uniref:Uncharacterized protein n=1 Tax=Bimuria novae-zelandiae CBS 107.79 TaxID=1447943 RepID=A0A6A5VLZ9_9PLEO|nr:hypothetical protein BU23DRAFT_579833 [Bimuria novae-zelandiae CBS 107.79]